MKEVGYKAETEYRDEADMVSLCSFKADGGVFGIDTREIREVLGPRTLERMPLAPAYISGLLSYRGDVLTAVSFRSLLGAAKNESQSCVLVLDGDGERFGLMVDSVQGVEVFERSQMTPNPVTLDSTSRTFFRGAYRMREGMLIQLDPARLEPARLAETGIFGPMTTGKEGM